jgi:hypothetical protein
MIHDATLARSSFGFGTLQKKTWPKGSLWVHIGGTDCTWKKIKHKIPPSSMKERPDPQRSHGVCAAVAVALKAQQ